MVKILVVKSHPSINYFKGRERVEKMENNMAFESKIRPIYWDNGKSKMIDQTVIPYEYKYIEISSGDDMFDAIRNMIVRGAPAIGIAGAQGIVLYAQEGAGKYNNIEDFKTWLLEKADYMATSRPTAVNLMWACEEQRKVIKNSKSDIEGLVKELTDKAIEIELDDINRCQGNRSG